MTKKPTFGKLEQRVKELEAENIRRKDEAKAMRENEKRIRLLSESAFEALVIHEEGLLIEANDQFFKMFGYEEQELLGKQVIPLIIAPESIEFMRKQISSGVKTPYDSIGIRKDGTKFPMEINAKPVEYQGRTVRVGAIRDLSERKRAEQTLRESEEKYRELANSLPQIVFEMNEKGSLIFANRNAFDIFGYTKTDFEKNLNALQMVIPEDRDRAMENIQKAMSGESLGGIEYTALTKNGDTFPIVIHSNRILQKNKTAGLRGIIIDLTERKRTEKALRESEEKYRTILKNIEDGYYEVDLAGNFTFFNDSICKFFGYSRDELMGMNNRQYMDEKNAKKLFQAFNSVFRTGKSYKGIDCEVIRKDGFRCYVEASVSLRRDSEGQSIGFQGIVRDISERKKAEEDKAKLEAQLLQAQKMEAIGTLAGGIAHDFNNLLMSIQGHTSLMLINIDPSLPHFRHLKGIEDNVKSGAGLTRQLLGFARGGKYEVKPTNLNSIITDSSEIFGRTKKEITIHRKAQKEIWTVEVDQTQIEQVLLNLYVNAWQAMSGTGELHLKTENVTLDEIFVKRYDVTPGRYVKISVADTGIGMDQATQQRIFDPFFTTKEKSRGTGLGLASSYGIIRSHGGVINVCSEKGKGATFNIYLPVSEKEPVKKEDGIEEVLKGTETVLFVDDEDIIIDVGKDLLEILRYTVLLAKNGKEAIEIYKKNQDKIDMVILDMIMPEMGGRETYDRLKEINPDIKVLLCSGYSIDGLAKTILSKGCDGFIQKPFTLKDISLKMREILDKE